jgi:hypothetical protein
VSEQEKMLTLSGALARVRVARDRLNWTLAEGLSDSIVADDREDLAAALESLAAIEDSIDTCESLLIQRNMAAAKFRDAVWQAHHQLSAAERDGWKMVDATVNLLRDQLAASERLCEEYGAPERKVWR